MKTDPRVDTYIAQAEPFAQPVLRRLRKLVHQGCPAAEETLKWSMPAYVLGKKILLITPSFKGHCRCVFWSAAVQAQIQRELGQTGRGMDLLGRIAGVADLPPDRLLLQFIRAAAASAAPGAKAPAEGKASARRAPRPPADLAAALRKTPRPRARSLISAPPAAANTSSGSPKPNAPRRAPVASLSPFYG